MVSLSCTTFYYVFTICVLFYNINIILCANTKPLSKSYTLNMDEEPENDVTRWGCKFETNLYKYNALNTPSKSKSAHYAIQDTPYLVPQKVVNNNEADEIVNTINPIIKEYITNHNTDTVNNFLEYYKMVDKHIKPDKFKQFFEDYSPAYNSKWGSTGQTIELLKLIEEKLKVKYNDIKLSMYLVSKQLDIDMNTYKEKELNKKTGLPKSVYTKFNVAGVIRLYVKRQDNPTEGYILIDPAGHSQEAIFLSTLSLRTSKTIETDELEITYQLHSDINHISKKIKNKNTQTINNDKDTKSKDSEPKDTKSKDSKVKSMDTSKDIRDVYYMGYPFCDFMKISEKISLFNFLRTIEKRNDQGKVICSLTFDISPLYKHLIWSDMIDFDSDSEDDEDKHEDEDESKDKNKVAEEVEEVPICEIMYFDLENKQQIKKIRLDDNVINKRTGMVELSFVKDLMSINKIDKNLKIEYADLMKLMNDFYKLTESCGFINAMYEEFQNNAMKNLKKLSKFNFINNGLSFLWNKINCFNKPKTKE